MITFEVIAITYRKAPYFFRPLITIYITDIACPSIHFLDKGLYEIER
ncbi:hypothetical protein SAMN05660236_1525 [Ohtaekwangia koreensis]|uniref:Uncharacterized protein n=1 Tax=Ohtaekwangia koreensis TaxID=688867 RepID=A0A1T5JVC5_9BACT|nr:hypothetical protein SAMN05660236_1525 [Ohtaekwangia koreensis]